MKLPDAAATLQVGSAIGAVLRAGDVVALVGPLGAGKTTLVRGMLQALGYAGEVPSPTYGLVIAYRPPDVMLSVDHADLYRVEHTAELQELDLDGVLAEGALIVEWPERLPPHLTKAALSLMIVRDGEGRRLTARVPPAWAGRWPIR